MGGAIEPRNSDLGADAVTLAEGDAISVVHADFKIERQYDCAPSQTFSAFSDPVLKGRWFALPTDWENRVDDPAPSPPTTGSH